MNSITTRECWQQTRQGCIHQKTFSSNLFKFKVRIYYCIRSSKSFPDQERKFVYLQSGFDYSVDNESLETLYWLKWGFVIEITGYVYSQKCKKNAKLNWVITFRILVTFFSKYKQKNASRVSRAQNILTFSFWHFHYTFDYKYSQWS